MGWGTSGLRSGDLAPSGTGRSIGNGEGFKEIDVARSSTVVGRETTEGPLLSKLRFESFGTREMADVEAGEMDLCDGEGGSNTNSGVVGPMARGNRDGGEVEAIPGGPSDNLGASFSLSDVSELSPRSSLSLLASFQQFLHPTIFSPSNISTEVNNLNDSSILGICESLLQRAYPFCAEAPTLGTPDNKAEKGLP